jgi:hypothetical protein
VAAWALGLSILAVIVQAVVSPAQAQPRQALIARAIARRICYEVYWQDNHIFRQGGRAQVNFLATKNKAYAWGGEFAQSNFGPENNKLFAIDIRGDRSWVARYFNSFDWNDYWSAHFVQRIIRETPASVRMMDFDIPSDCTPQFDPSTPWKERAIARITQAVEKESRKLAKPGDPATMDIVIGDFNFDYPQTGVYIPLLNKLMFADFRDEVDPPKDIGSLEGFRIEQLIAARWTETSIEIQGGKILRYGITRTIQWGK